MSDFEVAELRFAFTLASLAQIEPRLSHHASIATCHLAAVPGQNPRFPLERGNSSFVYQMGGHTWGCNFGWSKSETGRKTTILLRGPSRRQTHMFEQEIGATWPVTCGTLVRSAEILFGSHLFGRVEASVSRRGNQTGRGRLPSAPQCSANARNPAATPPSRGRCSSGRGMQESSPAWS